VFAHGELQDVSEFYTVPVFRRRQVGIRLAHFVFRTHPGRWQTRELIGADHSTAFWRKTISALVGDAYEEEVVPDLQWGRVTRQRFTI
jgi:predicted acetyltransferase